MLLHGCTRGDQHNALGGIWLVSGRLWGAHVEGTVSPGVARGPLSDPPPPSARSLDAHSVVCTLLSSRGRRPTDRGLPSSGPPVTYCFRASCCWAGAVRWHHLASHGIPVTVVSPCHHAVPCASRLLCPPALVLACLVVVVAAAGVVPRGKGVGDKEHAKFGTAEFSTTNVCNVTPRYLKVHFPLSLLGVIVSALGMHISLVPAQFAPQGPFGRLPRK